jgi:molybdopterin converting factor small subunit
MALVRLRGQLKHLAGGPEHHIAGATVSELLRELQTVRPGVRGWILDERGIIRQHINVFVNGESASAETQVADDDRIDVLPAISGG